MLVYLMSAGQLVPAAKIPIDRVAHGYDSRAGGNVQYRLTATPVFEEKSIRVVEQVVVRDSAQTPLRKSDVNRVFQLKGPRELKADRESLWTRVVGNVSEPSESAPPPADPARPVRKR
jgi:hypothetical protein